MNVVSDNYGLYPITRMWAPVDTAGLERFQLSPAGENWKLQGTMLRVDGGQAIEAKYRVKCDSHWHTVEVEIEVYAQTETRALLLENRAGLWVLNGERITGLDDCVDVDLGWTPSTNTLPIRRLDLASGKKKAAIDAIWISFPDLSLERLRQSYEPLGNGTYRYESGLNGFTADITVDHHGIVHDYKGHWKRVL
jgi:uncharacterized protein